MEKTSTHGLNHHKDKLNVTTAAYGNMMDQHSISALCGATLHQKNKDLLNSKRVHESVFNIVKKFLPEDTYRVAAGGGEHAPLSFFPSPHFSKPSGGFELPTPQWKGSQT